MRDSRISLFLASRSLSSRSHFSGSLLLPGTIVQSSWNGGAASCGPSNTTGNSRVGFDFMTSAASAPCKRAIGLAVAAPRPSDLDLELRSFLRSAVSAFEDVAVADRLAEPRTR